MGEWLTLQTDMSPYRCDKEKVSDSLQQIDDKLKKFYDYCEIHPRFKEEMFSKQAQERRSRETAMAFLGIEKPITLDPSSSFTKSEAEQEVEKLKIRKLLAYTDASQYMKDILHSEAPYLDQSVCLRAHATMCQGEEDKHLIVRYDRFRDESDPLIIVGQGYFNPVEGELVRPRMDLLFNKYYGEWFKDHPIVKGAKFLTEYYRIQPHMDGNKRMALLCMNFILQKDGYADVRFNSGSKEKLFDALKTAVLTHDVTDLVLTIAEKENERSDQWLEELIDYRLRIREEDEPDKVNLSFIPQSEAMQKEAEQKIKKAEEKKEQTENKDEEEPESK